MPDKRTSESGPPLVVERLLRATNDHDLAALVSCFAADYVNNTPAHPDRSFTGRAQVHTNWQRLFAGIPDLRAELLDEAVDGETVWTEWRMHGTRPDGAAHELVGTILFTVRGDEISRAAFYLEPVERDSGTVDDQIARVANGATIMTVLVAGGSGRLGRLVVRSLIADGTHVRVLTRDKERAIDVQALGAEPVVGDLSDSAAVDRAVEGCSTVIAAASGFGPMGSASPRSVDRDGTATLISRSEQAGVARFVLVSMQGAAPRATLEILRMKNAAEQVLRSSGMTWTIIRPAPFLETYLEVVGQPMRRRNATLVFGKGNVAAEFVPVADVAALVCTAVRHPERGGGIVEGRGEERTLNELSETVHRAAGRPGRTIHVPVWFMRVVSVAARPVSPFASRAAAGAVWITSRRR